METDTLKGLNPEQLDAATSTEGFIRVIAGAGSGKTRALAHRFAYLVNEVGINPANILCVTFTNKAAGEMKQRIRALIGDNDLGHVCTFHAFCVTVLKEDINTLCYPKSFAVLDTEDENDILKIIYEERALTSRDMTFSKARDMIEIIKNIDIPDYYNQLLDMSFTEVKKLYDKASTTRDIIFWGYIYYQKRSFGLDYNDLIILTLHIFNKFPDIRDKWQQKLEYIMVDEFQDIDDQQYHFAEVLCGYHSNLFIVGDPDQTVYSWRGANVKYINDFDKNFPGTKTIYLNSNYRSTPQIIAAANSLIARNKNRIKKELVATRENGQSVVYDHLKTTADEAKWVADEVMSLLSRGVKPAEIGILYRAHFVSRALEEEFLERGIKYMLFSGVQFYCRKEIKDVLAYLRMLSCGDDMSFTRTVNEPKRNIGERRMKFLKAFAEKNESTLYFALRLTADDEIWSGTDAEDYIKLIEKYSAEKDNYRVSELLDHIIIDSGYEEALRTNGGQDRLDNLAELKQSICEYETTCGEDVTLDLYLAQAALFTNTDVDAKSDCIRLMTVHSAKGLEFPYVFVCGFNEGIFPSKKTDTIEKLEEERRLAYVALTRAKDGLYLCDSEGFNHDGTFRYPSRFILNIDRSLVEYRTELDERLLFDTESHVSQQERMMLFDIGSCGFNVGDIVLHAVMGRGEIVAIDAINMCYVIKFDNLKTNRNISARVKLIKVK